MDRRGFLVIRHERYARDDFVSRFNPHPPPEEGVTDGGLLEVRLPGDGDLQGAGNQCFMVVCHMGFPWLAVWVAGFSCVSRIEGGGRW